MAQLVVKGNRILSYGEDCFIAVNGNVICTNENKVYENATVVECDNIPSDIDSVGYEYHSGAFVPCAPFGKGTGNVAVLCDENCKSIKDSGIPFSQIGEIIEFTYTGNGSSYNGVILPVELHKKPKILFISGNDATGIILTTPGVGFSIKNALFAGGSMAISVTNPFLVTIKESESGFSVTLEDVSLTMNSSGKTYSVTAIC